MCVKLSRVAVMHNKISQTGIFLSSYEVTSLLHNRRNDICQRYFIHYFLSGMENVGQKGIYVDLVSRVFRSVCSVVATSQ